MRREFSRDYSKHLFAGGSVIFGESFGIGTRVSDCLVLFVESLSELEGSACGQMMKSVGFFLQGRQVIEASRALGRTFLRLGDVCRRGLLDLFEYPFRFLLVP